MRRRVAVPARLIVPSWTLLSWRSSSQICWAWDANGASRWLRSTTAASLSQVRAAFSSARRTSCCGRSRATDAKRRRSGRSCCQPVSRCSSQAAATARTSSTAATSCGYQVSRCTASSSPAGGAARRADAAAMTGSTASPSGAAGSDSPVVIPRARRTSSARRVLARWAPSAAPRVASSVAAAAERQSSSRVPTWQTGHGPAPAESWWSSASRSSSARRTVPPVSTCVDRERSSSASAATSARSGSGSVAHWRCRSISSPDSGSSRMAAKPVDPRAATARRARSSSIAVRASRSRVRSTRCCFAVASSGLISVYSRWSAALSRSRPRMASIASNRADGVPVTSRPTSAAVRNGR